ncbi:hypothetical protein GLE_2431 [Lysobacter enzymogenes]|uniref:X-Tfes XVIPCD domain-containing protein n=1 Tax=Lysobacter enzymogenes TaxID=69 RepID=A0A0S2DH59_LYSEN|nr:XVIPCD domain-containing protein [Lysobacter enzymogenes]ALN57780.1 hypothetical protein GLE_2431 [Lysobacter enzymogenes]
MAAPDCMRAVPGAARAANGSNLMGFTLEEKTLKSGETVTLVHWEDLSPTRHGKALQDRDWDGSGNRKGLSFYDSTSEYMHNSWASEHMAPQGVTLPGKGSLMLYHHEQTGTWHSADALDIDHVAQWKDHFVERGVKSQAEAMMAYNDVDNLRLLPAPVNRARDAAFRVLDTHGADSPEWKQWVEDRFAFDPKTNRPGFDPDVDGSVRKRTTMEQPWKPEDGRSGLSFDAAVLGKWYQAKLQECYAGEVEVRHPQTGDKSKVPLFFCQASGQLCTRDAFDIDHEIPFELLGPEMAKHAGRDGLSKADALDGYNDTSNLRLVARGVNSSHDFEIQASGDYRDEKIAPEKRGEFKGFLGEESGLLSPQLKQQLRELGRNYPSPQQLMSDFGQPGYGPYTQALGKLEQTGFGQAMTAQERSNVAGTLAVAATHYRLNIDHVAQSDDGSRVFAIQGDPKNNQFVWADAQGAKQQSLAQSTVDLNRIVHEQNNPSGPQLNQQQQRNATLQ